MRYFWEYDIIYSNSQRRIGARKINGGDKFSEIKVQKARVVMFVVDWNLTRYLGLERPIVYKNFKKMDMENKMFSWEWYADVQNWGKISPQLKCNAIELEKCNAIIECFPCTFTWDSV